MIPPLLSTAATHEPAHDLVFFGPGLHLREFPGEVLAAAGRRPGTLPPAESAPDRAIPESDRPSQDPPAEDAAAPHRPDPPAGLVTAAFSARRRFDRACWLLGLVEATQGGRAQPDAAEVWDWLEAEWRWVGRSRGSRRILEREVRKGTAAPADTVARVQNAIRDELLPLLRLKWLLIGVRDQWERPDLDVLVKSLQTCQLTNTASPGCAAFYAEFLHALGRLDIEPSVTVLGNVRRLLQRLGSNHPRAWDLTLAFANLFVRAIIPRIQPTTPRAWLNARLSDAKAVDAVAPPCLALHDVISVLHLVCGARDSKVPSHLAESCRHTVRALAYDPHNATARENFQQLREMARNLQQQIAQMQPGQQLTAEGAQASAALRQGTSFLDAFAQSDEATTIGERRRQALRRELAWRLALDPTRPDHLEIAARLPTAVHQAREELPAKKATPSAIHRHVSEGDPALAPLPWNRIRAVLEKNPPADEEFFALLLPLPEPPSDGLSRTLLPRSTPPAAAASNQQSPARRPWPAMWWLSGRNLGWKLTSLAGAGLLAWSLSTEVQTRSLEQSRESLYSQLVSAARQDDLGAVLTLAPDFLRHPALTPADPRKAQAEDWLQSAAYREFLRRLSADPPAESAAFLSRFQDTLAQSLPASDSN